MLFSILLILLFVLLSGASIYMGIRANRENRQGSGAFFLTLGFLLLIPCLLFIFLFIFTYIDPYRGDV
jgi:uncharacterized membrane protein